MTTMSDRASLRASCAQAAKDAVQFQDERDALAARLAEAEALLRETVNDTWGFRTVGASGPPTGFAPEWVERRDAFLGDDNGNV